MKKVDIALRKLNQSQRKISVYFMKTSKNESLKNNNTNNIVESNVINDETHRKRKVSENLDLLTNKITKYDDSDTCNARNTQRQKHILSDESNVIHNGFYKDNINTSVIKTKYKDVTECDFKENIAIDKHESSDKYILSKGYNTDSMVESEHSNVIKHEEIHSPFFIDDFNECFDEEWPSSNQINLNSLQRCKIIDVKREYNSILLTVQKEDIDACNTTVMCFDFWKNAKVEKNDIVAIQARKEGGEWIVDNISGYLVVHPDLLLSGTTIVKAIFCKRRAVLAEKFRKMENLPYFKENQLALAIGCLAHQLLQTAIQQNVCELSDIKKIMEEILKSRDTSSLLYASKITLDTCRQQLLTYVSKVFEFIQHYIKDKEQQQISNIRDNFKGRITHIHDIEENIWFPKLGIGGKVDVTVEVNINLKKKIMPLEIKTGKPSFSLEHRGQIILYIMMMAFTGQDTDTGLLLYLRENNVQEIKAGHPEKRDLILLRNTIANYFIPKSAEKLSLTSESDWQTLELPEPINHQTACSKCTYNALCCAYLSKDSGLQLAESHPLAKLAKQILNNFKLTHVDYVLQWISLLELEESALSSDNVTRYIWTLSPEKREAKKTCISNLKVAEKVEPYNSKYKHTFFRTNKKIPYMEFSDNEYILVSTNTKINISAGFIVQRKDDSITVLLDRNITKYNINEYFHIDKFSSSSLLAINLANIGGLLGDDPICTKLRDIVIDRKPATFKDSLSYSVICKSATILQDLNKSQQRAVLKVLSANDYVLIKGMAGTGKTQTLVALIQVLHKTGHSVLITAHTNNAVDNILLKLLDKNIDFLRLGSSFHPSLKDKAEEYVTSNCCSPDSLEAIYTSKNIVGVTCYGAHHALLAKRVFDICIVDESAQALQPTILRPLYNAKKYVLVGDPDQLPPIVKSKLARKLGAEESLFARLDSENNTVSLMKQYRMNKSIMYLANKLTYNDMLEAGNTLIENATFVPLYREVLIKEEKWVQNALSSDISDSVIILNTGCTNNLKINCKFNAEHLADIQVEHLTDIRTNIWEAAIVLKLVQTLLKMGANLENIGIIAPYRLQVNLLKQLVNGVETNTVDQFQGRDKEIIIYSCTKSLTNGFDIKEDLEVLGDHRRLTVAITRAKHKLIIIADKSTISQYSAFKKLFSLIEDKNIINLKDCCDGFSWENLASIL